MKILIILTVGILIGYFLKFSNIILKIINKSIKYSICILLFLLGLKIGSNQDIIYKLHNIGFQALILALATILGSVIVSAVFQRYFFDEK